ncbi:MAG: hypothetical protein AB7K52_08850 [Phycisphaerales bacterium]
MHLRRSSLATLVLAAVSFGSPARGFAAPPTDAEIDAAIEEVLARVKDLRPPQLFEARARAVKEVMARLAIGELTLPQIERLREKGMFDESMRSAVFDRLGTLAKEPTIDGAAAAALRMEYVSPDFDIVRTGPQREQARAGIGRAGAEALRHPKIREAWQAERALDALGRLNRADPAALAGPEVIDALEKALAPGLGWPVIVRLATLLEALASAEAGHAPADLARITSRGLALLNELKPTSPEDERSVAILNGFFRGAMARGELLGRPAPWPTLAWASPGLPIDLNDLKGRVVVVLFWHTQAKGSVRALVAAESIRKRYESSPVTVVGITGVQGRAVDYTTDPKKPQRVDTTSDPQREYVLTRELMGLRNVDIHLGFAATPYNADFGVVRVPLAAVIDPKGIVVMRAGDPRETIDQICARIDELLEKFDLPRPAETAPVAPAVPGDARDDE